jgi:hypothetical protein
VRDAAGELAHDLHFLALATRLLGAGTLGRLGAQRVQRVRQIDRALQGACPDCGVPSRARHSSYLRHLQDLPVQAAPVTVALRVSRLHCRNPACGRRTFVEPLPAVAERMARRTARLAAIVHCVGYALGGRPAERLLARLGTPASDDTLLRMLKRRAG